MTFPATQLGLTVEMLLDNAALASLGTFEVDLESWVAGGSVPPTLTRDGTHVHNGSWAMKIAWGTGGSFPQAAKTVSGLRPGASYKLTAWGYVPTGDPAIKFAVGGVTVGNPTTLNDVFQPFELTFTATAAEHNVQVWPNTAPVSGDLAWVDDIQIVPVWTDITSLVYLRDDQVITRGASERATTVEPSTFAFTANNRNGNLSPRNPTGSFYGVIGRNTRCRARLSPATPGYLMMGDPDRANTPDTANLSITGDIDIRLDLQPDSWTLAQGLANKLLNPTQRSWALALNADSTLSFAWSAAGSTLITKTSTAAVSPPASGRLAVRVTLDVDNGAAGNDVKFYTATDISSSWVQLGSTVTTAGTTSVFDSTASLEVGGSQGVIAADDLRGRLYAFQMLQGIAGTLKADVNFDNEDAGAATFLDESGNTWTLINDASIVDPAVRFHGEVSEWPQRWDVSGRDIAVPITASGILRRLTQGTSPLRSVLYRAYTSLATPPKAYWPCEDGADSTTLASALGGPPMTYKGTPNLAANSDFKCSEPLPLLASGGASGQWTGTIPAYTATNKVQVWFLLSIPVAGATNGQGIFNLYTGGSVRRWTLVYGTGGTLTLKGYDGTDTEVQTSGALGFLLDGNPERISLRLEQNASNVDWELLGQRLDGGVGGTGGSFNSETITRATSIVVNPGGGLGDVAFGHVSVHSEVRSPFDLISEFIAHTGETAGRRIQRLCSEEGVAFRAATLSNLDASTPMGAQLPKTLPDLLAEAAEADGGILFEPRDLFGLSYRTRESMYRQAAALALTYTAGHLSGIEPVDDDQLTRNDITVQREGGSSFRAVQQTGVLSVLAPPAGVGRYDDQVTLSLASDGLLPDAAGWRLHLGTVDEARYPVLSVDLARSVFASNQTLMLAAQDLDVGDRLTVASPPVWLPPDLISQLALGFVETMNAKTHRISVNCAPESPWAQVAIYDDGISRYTSDGSTLAASLTSGATSASVATPSGPLWSHADGDFQIRVGGEVMTVTAVTGGSSPQTFTINRSVNGVVKAHSANEAVELELTRVYVP